MNQLESCFSVAHCADSLIHNIKTIIILRLVWCVCDERRTLQNYLGWTLIMDRVSSLSRRFKDVRAHYRKVSYTEREEQRRARVTFSSARSYHLFKESIRHILL